MTQRVAHLYWTDDAGNVERTEIGTRPLTAGTHELCAIRLAGEGTALVHATVAQSHEGHTVRRLTRTRTLLVNGGEVQEKTLQGGDRIGIGDAEVTYVGTTSAPGHLSLSFGKDDFDGQVEVVVAGHSIVIGAGDADVIVADASVSGRHLEIESYGPGFLWARDLESTNGSELNGEPLTARRLLELGDTLKVGRVTVVVGDGGDGEVAVGPRSVTFEAGSMRA